MEGHLSDVRPEPFDFPGGQRAANEPMHSMWLRLTLDGVARIVAAVAVTEAAPYEECGAVAPDYGALVGLTIGPGFRERVRGLFAKTRGCTHMNELLSAMATAAIQTLADEEFQPDPNRKPFQIDGCHAWASDNERVARFYPRWYRKPAA